MVGLPNFSRGIQRARGRLLPFGWLHILRAMKKASQLDLMLGAVDKAWRHRGLEVLMGVEMMRAAAAGGLYRVETHLVLENNQPMRAVYEKNGAALIKRFRIYQRPLD
jgi:ribosomal protein S18 acetylase RimI-like enzyme